MKLKIMNLNKSFDGKILLRDFSYSFDDTGIYAVIGESGAGKTTLLRMIAGLEKEYSGSIIGGGIGQVSMAFQEYRLFPQLNALENVIFAISDKKDKAELDKAQKMLSRLGFNEKDMQLLPDELSGGMRQRVSLARAFLKKSPILLLDEPTKELDKENAEAVLDLIRETAKDRLVIFVSHNSADIDELSAIKIAIQTS
nr:ABC transporter ATP-binding protein [Oscillospiraceae bacterium]